MKVYDAASIRNVALVGHTGSGKTQLAAAILSTAGMVNRFGKVDEGTTVTDFDEEEIARKHTLSASLAYAEWNKHKINIIDTPGIGNFLSDARAALTVADAALVVVDAVAGVMVQTEKVWEAAQELELPRIVVLNRIGSRSGQPRSIAAVAARGLRPDGDSHPAADRRGKSVQGRRRSRQPQGIYATKPTRAASSPRGPCPPTWPRRSRRRARR